MLRIDLAPLKEGLHQLHLETTPEALDLDPAVFSDVGVEAVLDYHNDQALVSLTATATARLECDRTLVLFDQSIEGTYEVLFVPPERRRQEAEDVEEVRVLEPSDPVLDITEAVRDTLMLAIPARKVAPGAEDAELPMHFGDASESEPDPRWAALKALRDADSEAAG